MYEQLSIFDILCNHNQPLPKITQEQADWWFIKNSTPIIHNGVATWRVNNGDIVGYDERISYIERNGILCTSS